MIRGRDTLPPIVLQLVGLGILLFFVGFWAVTSRVEPIMLSAAGTLIGAGLVKQSGEKVKSVDTDDRPKPKPSNEPTGSEGTP